MYQALYRKYRPKDFGSVVGQDSLVKTLKNSVKNNSFCHAYMFFGPRGTGKTTLSKIFARTINCLNPIDGNACGSCINCTHSSAKECVDIIEIDAASNNGVDEIRELKNKISLVPAQLKFKVYIIDEVHMLSLGAFNALLKTLEEPPEHAIFILATTDPQKVPETIISRCQCFSFKRISEKSIVERLKFISKTENIEVDDDVLMEIALASEGGMRDALGLLDKLRSFIDGKITIVDFVELNGLVTQSDLKNLVDSIMDGNNASVLQLISSYNESGKNLIQIISQVMHYLRNILVSHYISNEKCQYDIDNLIQLINTINEKMFDIKKSGNPNIFIEMLLLKFINENVHNDKIISREIKVDFSNDVQDNVFCQQSEKKVEIKPREFVEIKDNYPNFTNEKENINNIVYEDKIDNNVKVSLKNNLDIDALRIENLNEIMKARVNNTLAAADKQILKNAINDMNVFNDYTFDDEIGYIACSLLDAKIRAASIDSIIISYDYDSVVKQNLLDLEKFSSVYNKLTNSNKKLAIITDEEWEIEKNNYIKSIKEGHHYTIIEEPELKVFEGPEEDVIITNSAIELFGDIVEIE